MPIKSPSASQSVAVIPTDTPPAAKVESSIE
jgi:hypothetical protein